MTPVFDTFLVYSLHPDLKRMKVHPRLVGKYLLHDGIIHVVEDHDGILDGLDEQPLAQNQSRIQSLMNSHYYLVDKKKPPDDHKEVNDWENEVFSDSDAADGGEVEKPSRDGVFHYHREGYNVPRVLEAKSGNLTLDGKDVSREEVQVMIDNAKKGAAKITYVKPPAFAEFRKTAAEASAPAAPGDEGGHLGALSRAQLLLSKEDYDALRNAIYQDEMIPSLGNKKAHNDFLATPQAQGGVHVMLDGDGMKAINDVHGHQAGDEAIRSLGNALRSAIDKTVGQENAKAHRFGGDEFYFWTKTPEHAHTVLRQLHENLANLPDIGGTHKVGFSAGIGENRQIADAALAHAKDQKKAEVAEMMAKEPEKYPDARMVQPTKPLRVHSLLKQPTPTPTAAAPQSPAPPAINEQKPA